MNYQQLTANNDLLSMTEALDALGEQGFRLQVILEHDSTTTLLLAQSDELENFNYEVVRTEEDLDAIQNAITDMAVDQFYVKGFWQAGKGYTLFFEQQLPNDEPV